MSLPAVIFEDVEQWAVATLTAALAARDEPYAQDVYVAADVPEQRKPRMVIVRRDGGGQLDAVREAPRMGVQVFAPDHIAASNLARLCAALLWSSPNGDPVCRVTITGGPYRVAEKTGPLYYFTAELISRGSTL